MIFTDDYTPFHNEADYCEEKNETQDKQIEELSNKLKQLKDEVQEMQSLINGLDFKIDDKYEAQTQTLSQNITDAVNTLQNGLANKTSSALVEADHVQTKTLNADEINTSSISAKSTISASVYVGSSINVSEGRIGTFSSDVESIQKSTIYYLNAVNAVITNLNMTNLKAETFESRLATIDSLTSGMSNIARLNADLITVSDSGEWHEPTAQPNNDELLKVSFPYYDGIINIVSQNDSLNLSIVNNTLVTFNQKDLDLYRVDFNKANKNGHFEYKTDDSSITLPLFETGTFEVSVGGYHTVMELVYGVEKSENLSDTTYFSYDGGNTLIMSYPYGSEVTATFDCILKTPRPTVDLYFRKSFNYKEIHIGGDKYDRSFSKIVDRTLYENNINDLTGTVSATEITYGDNINVSVIVLDELPEEGIENTIYVVRNDRSYFYNTENEKFEPMSLKTDIVSGHVITGRIDESLIYPVVQYTPDYSLSAFSGTFYEVPDFIKSDQIPTDANFIYLESGNVRFCYTPLPPHHGTQFGTSNEVLANKEWFESIEWLKDASGLHTKTVTPVATEGHWKYYYDERLNTWYYSFYHRSSTNNAISITFTVQGRTYTCELTDGNGGGYFKNGEEYHGNLIKGLVGYFVEYRPGEGYLVNIYSTNKNKPGDLPTATLEVQNDDGTVSVVTLTGSEPIWHKNDMIVGRAVEWVTKVNDKNVTFKTARFTINNKSYEADLSSNKHSSLEDPVGWLTYDNEFTILYSAYADVWPYLPDPTDITVTYEVESNGETIEVALSSFMYKVPAITISDEAGHSETVDTHKVQDYVVNKQNEINNMLDLRSEGNFIRSSQNKEDIATNRANIQTNADNIKAINDAKGQPNGFASLDSEGHLPVEQLPTSALVYKGQWDASSGAYPVQTTYIIGDFYIVSVEGTINGIKFYVGDWIIWNGSAWERSANANAVASVNGKTGAVVLSGTDIKLTSDSTVDLEKAVNDGAGDEQYTFTLDGSVYTVAGMSSSGLGTYCPIVYTRSSTGVPIMYGLGIGGWFNTAQGGGDSIVGITHIMAQLAADSFINWQTKQEKLVSGTNIKTINNKSLLGSGNITLADLGISIV